MGITVNRRVGHCRPLVTLLAVLVGICFSNLQVANAEEELLIGVAQSEFTPPLGFPMSGYYHERLAAGTLDPLWAKAIYFRQGDTEFAWVSCDLTGAATDLVRAVREKVSKKTGIPANHISVSATHSHTAPDYYRSLYLHLGPESELKTEKDRKRAAYAGEMIEKIAAAVIAAKEQAQPGTLKSGAVRQETPVSFCRRFVMRDGSVQTWANFSNPNVLRSSAPIDPEIQLLKIHHGGNAVPTAVVSNFALHLDTVGGDHWSGDYPYAIEQVLKKSHGDKLISLFGTGCCGDINHADPSGKTRRKSLEIGEELGKTISATLPNLTDVSPGKLQVRRVIVPLALEEMTPADVLQSIELIKTVNSGEKIPFFDHVRAYKRLMLDHLINKEPHPETVKFLSAGLSHTLKGGGETLPAEVVVATLGNEVAFVFLPGEVFTELGLAIKQASPFRTTIIVELANGVETFYVPNQHAYVGGGYEPTNSLVQPGSGERLVEAALSLLKDSATAALRPEGEKK